MHKEENNNHCNHEKHNHDNHNHDHSHAHNGHHHHNHMDCICGKDDCLCEATKKAKNTKFTSGCSSNFCKEELEEESEEPPSHCHHHHEHKDGLLSKFSQVMGWTGGHDHDHHHHHGHGGHEHIHTFETKRWILIVATILGSIALIHMIGGLFLDGPVMRFLDNPISQLVLGSIAFFIMGIAFLKGSYITLKNKQIAEDTLVAIATTSAFLYSVFAFIINATTNMQIPFFFNEEIEVLWLIYLGRFIEDWLTNKVTREISSLEELKPKTATILREGKEIEMPATEIVLGDVVIVKPGQLIPVDGIVKEGETSIDESSLTGESLHVNKTKGSTVFGGTISSNGLIKIEATKTLNESFISQIINSVNESMGAKPKSQRMADKIASYLIPSVLVIATLTFFITGLVFQFGVSTPNSFQHLANGDYAWLYSFYVTITVLVIACPCSFAMITPMSVLASSSTSKSEGVIFSSDTLFEVIKSVDVICFDKTGTLTEGKFDVINTNIDDKYIEEIVSIEKTSNHPLANSIVKHYKDIKLKDIKVNEVIGKGVESANLKVGSLKWVIENFPSFKEDKEVTERRKQGSAIIYAFNQTEVLGYIELRDTIKSTTLETLSQIRKLGIDVVMITGDQKDTALNVASQLGINEKNVYSEVSPQDKSQIIEKIQKQGKVVSFVGDGINDSVALIQSDIGIAMGEGSDAAIESADIVLRDDDLSKVAYSIWLSRRTLFTIKRGFGIAIVYNAVMVPVAATGILGLTGAGPALAALSMIFNDSIAMINAMSLKAETKKKYDRKYKTKNKN